MSEPVNTRKTVSPISLASQVSKSPPQSKIRLLFISFWKKFCRLVVKIFYSHFEVTGHEVLTEDSTSTQTHSAGIILCVNHVNALIDGVVLQASTERNIRPLARSGLFENPLMKPILDMMGAVPIYRRKNDEVLNEGRNSNNQDSFTKCYELLAQNEMLVIFPEGQSHSDPYVHELKTGAARMALGAIETNGMAPLVLPVGLTFTRKRGRRTKVLVQYGQAIDLNIPDELTDEYKAVRLITDRVKMGLKSVTLNTKSWKDLSRIRRLEGFFALRHGKRRKSNQSQRFNALQRLINAQQLLQIHEPDKVRNLMSKLRLFEKLCGVCGVKNYHLSIEYRPMLMILYTLRTLSVVLIGFPIALWGIVNSYIPSKIVALLTRKFSKDIDQYDTALVLLGMAIFSLFWGIQVYIVYQFYGLNWSLFYMISLLVSSYMAMSLRGEYRRTLVNLKVFFMFIRKRDLKDYLEAKRNELEVELAQMVRIAKRLSKINNEFSHVNQEPLKEVFESEMLIVQNAGMARWLSLHVADSTGISANMKVYFPAEFMWELLRLVLPDVPEQDPCAPRVLRWRLMEVLLENLEDFPEVQHYLDGSDDTSNAWELASELSQLLDQYLFYRDDWVRKWEMSDAKQQTTSSENWQARLWQKAISQKKLVHWLALQDKFVESIDQIDSSELPERVSFFSLSALSPGYLRLLGELAKKIDIHLYIINPCMEYWGEVQSEKQLAKLRLQLPVEKQAYYEVGNPLLASMGRQGREFLDQLLDLPTAKELTHWQETEPKNLLQLFQNDVLNLVHPLANKPDKVFSSSNSANVIDFNQDASIQIHACHTAMREVEVLQDQLLDLIQHNPDIAPSDMVVMMPDIDKYAPYIEAVFSSGIDSKNQLPFSIADRNPATSQHAIEALLKVLNLVDTRFDAESVFELLDYADIREHFSLQESEVIICRELARSTNIRWGISAESRKKESLLNTPEHTWRYALDRMLLGYAMPGDVLFSESIEGQVDKQLPILPYNEIEGSNALLLASLKRFTEVVFKLNDWSNQRLGLEEWLEKIKHLTQNLFVEAGQTKDLFNTLDSLKQQSHLAEFSLELPFSVVRRIVTKSLQEVSGSENFMGFGITFCALVPMRSVPFKVVALMGMNDGEFPRQNKHHSFDLMADKPRRGDRSRRDEDRYLFLESILAAREKLIISYTGQSVQDNTDLPPSIMVSELLDNLEKYDQIKATDRLIKHPLQAFSSRYFTEESSELFSYAKEYIDLYKKQSDQQDQDKPSQVFLTTPLEELDAEQKRISLDELIAFYQGPAREFLKKRFALKTYDNDPLLPVREPFELESFVDRKIRDQVLNQSTAKSATDDMAITIDCDDALLVSRAKGLLPHGDIGGEIFDKERKTIETFAQQLPEISPVDNHGFSLEIGEFQLNGELTQLTESGRVNQQVGKAYARDYISLWINHLVLNVEGQFKEEQSTSYFYSPETQFKLTPLISSSDNDAVTQLKALLGYYWKGLHFPLFFFPKPAFKMYEKNKDKGSIKLAIDAWENSYLGSSEKDKFENWLLYRVYDQDELFGDEFEVISELVFGGMYGCYNEI
ncbi:RecBCD enzyme subunit RecC [Nymphon striatum]|nr:RecBCD enzyme subunit RecC [Nymphon striatum]